MPLCLPQRPCTYWNVSGGEGTLCLLIQRSFGFSLRDILCSDRHLSPRPATHFSLVTGTPHVFSLSGFQICSSALLATGSTELSGWRPSLVHTPVLSGTALPRVASG